MIQKKFVHDVVLGSTDSVSALKAARLNSQDALEVYRDSFIGVHIKSLEHIYPVTLALLGQSPFRAHARRYLDKYPPSNPDLLQFGDLFFSFLSLQPELTNYPLIHDMAHFEWHWHILYHAKDEAPFPLADFQKNAQRLSEMTLIPSKNLRLLPSSFALPTIWHQHLTHDIQEAKAHQEYQITLVFRQGLEVAATLLNEGEHYFLSHLESSLEEIALSWQEHWPNLETVLIKAIQKEWLINYTLKDS